MNAQPDEGADPDYLVAVLGHVIAVVVAVAHQHPFDEKDHHEAVQDHEVGQDVRQAGLPVAGTTRAGQVGLAGDGFRAEVEEDGPEEYARPEGYKQVQLAVAPTAQEGRQGSQDGGQ